jgi:hypothetical protein
VSDFEKHLARINEIVTLAEQMAGAGRVNTTLAEIAERLPYPQNEIIRVFEVLGVRVASWSEPSLYKLSDIVEAGTRHEVSQRF